MVSENISTICVENCHEEYGKCGATVPRCFLKFLTKSFPMFCVTEKPVILVEVLLKLRIVVIQYSEMAMLKKATRSQARLPNKPMMESVGRPSLPKEQRQLQAALNGNNAKDNLHWRQFEFSQL